MQQDRAPDITGALIDMSRAALVDRMRVYFDPTRSLDDLPGELLGLKTKWARFDATKTREKVIRKTAFDEAKVKRIVMKPMDVQWAYVETTRPLWNEPRPGLVKQLDHTGMFVLARRRAPRADDGAPFLVTRSLCDEHALHKDAYQIPVTVGASLHSDRDQASFLDVAEAALRPNVSPGAAALLEATGCTAEDLWLHVMAIGFSPQYLRDNAGGIRQDWPRIPLPATGDAFLASTELGRRVAALIDVESPADGVTAGNVRFELRPIGLVTKADGSQVDPDAGDLAVTAGWGHAGQGGVTMPARGRLAERAYADLELAAFREGVAGLGLTFEELLACLGDTCVDVYLNDRAYWRCVPKRVWTYTIGGYQVIKKWLSYRERPLLGRDLRPDEARHVTEMARRIAAILLLGPALDANYERVKVDTYAWPGDEGRV